MTACLKRLVLYCRSVPEMARFYEAHFGYRAVQWEGDRIVELVPPGDGVCLMLHPAAKGMRPGQALVKLVFDVKDIPRFHATCRKNGLEFGPIHQADGYEFANAKDPCQNSISISSRAFRPSD